jgi:hypothetical protein
MVQPALQYALSAREYELLRSYITTKGPSTSKRSFPLYLQPPGISHDHNTSTFRSALRVYLFTTLSLKSLLALRLRLFARRSRLKPPKPLIPSPNRLALSLAAILFLHRTLFRFFSRLRLQLLHEKTTVIRERYPRLFSALTSKFAPAVGGSLAGLALGIYPAVQLRLTFAIYTGARSLEFLYNAIASARLINPPWWFGSWMLFALSQGQLLHAFVFDRDCFPAAYSDFILKYTPEYIQPRPSKISPKTAWPSQSQIVDSLASMAESNWPTFTSPLLHPSTPSILHLPPGINPVISNITSRASPLITSLSCALIHPSSPSCLLAYLRQNLLALPQLCRFFTLYYGAFSLLRWRKFVADPIPSFNRLAGQILRTTAAISGAIGASWGSICLFGMLFPRSFLPRFRFVLGGLLGGCFGFLDRSGAGRTNSLYASRVSAESLWKVGVKHRWWRGVKGGDVYVFVVGLAVLNCALDWQGEKGVDSGVVRGLLGLMRGDSELGLGNRSQEKGKATGRGDGTYSGSQSQSGSGMWEKVEKEE